MVVSLGAVARKKEAPPRVRLNGRREMNPSFRQEGSHGKQCEGGPSILKMLITTPKRSPVKGVWQKSDEKSERSIRKSDQNVTERVPKTKKE